MVGWVPAFPTEQARGLKAHGMDDGNFVESRLDLDFLTSSCRHSRAVLWSGGSRWVWRM